MAVVFVEITLTCAGTNVPIIYSCTKKSERLTISKTILILVREQNFQFIILLSQCWVYNICRDPR